MPYSYSTGCLIHINIIHTLLYSYFIINIIHSCLIYTPVLRIVLHFVLNADRTVTLHIGEISNYSGNESLFIKNKSMSFCIFLFKSHRPISYTFRVIDFSLNF